MPETTSAPPPPGLRDRPKARAEAVNTGEPVRVNAPPHPRWPSGRPQASCRPKSVKTAGRSTPPRHPPPPPGTKSRTHVTHSVKPAQKYATETTQRNASEREAPIRKIRRPPPCHATGPRGLRRQAARRARCPRGRPRPPRARPRPPPRRTTPPRLRPPTTTPRPRWPAATVVASN